MHAASGHVTPSLLSLPKDGRLSCLVIHRESDPSRCWPHRTKLNFSCLTRTDWEAWPPDLKVNSARHGKIVNFLTIISIIFMNILPSYRIDWFSQFIQHVWKHIFISYRIKVYFLRTAKLHYYQSRICFTPCYVNQDANFIGTIFIINDSLYFTQQFLQ